MRKIELKSRRLLRNIFSGMSLTAIAFIFQACYGMGPDMYYDIKLTGKVTSKTTNLPIRGIKVTVNDDNYYFGTTDANGEFDFYTTLDDYYSDVRIQFLDIDGSENGSFNNRTIIIEPERKNEIKINVELDEKE